MNITIANLSKQIFEADFKATVAAIGRQVTEHFQPEWGTGATLTGVWVPLVGKKAPIQKGADEVIYLGDSSVDPTTGVKDADGYHSANNKGMPYGFVYLDICAQAKEAWSFTLSHEVLELLAAGRTVRAAAKILGLSVKTVDAHKFNLMRKLGIHNKAELVMWAIQKRILKLPANF